MRFVLFTDKTLAQCTSAINERLQAPSTASRPGVDGWVQKSGRFSLALTTSVIGKFTRTTRLEAQIERESGQIVIRGNVADGVGPQGQIIILIGMVLVAVMLLIQGQQVLGIIALAAGAVLYLSLRGDYENSDKLLMEVERTLKASPRQPKAKPGSAVRSAAARPAAAKGTALKKPTGVKSGSSATVKKPTSAKSTAVAKKPAAAAAGRR